jgi:hypothetical protein
MKNAIFVFLLLIPLFTSAQNKMSWDFPIKPGSSEWKNAKSYKERLNLYNIPEDILNKLSTSELVKTCLNYPEYRLIFTCNDLQSGYDYIKSEFNGFKELEARIDAGKELLIIYKGYLPNNFNKSLSDVEIGNYIAKFTYLELLIAQSNILNKLPKSELYELRIETLKKFKEKKDIQEYFGVLGLVTPTLILARADYDRLQSKIKDFNDLKYQNFLHNGILNDPKILDEIILQCENFKNEQ